MEKISSVLITRNESGTIEECLKSIQSFSDEIIILDSNSTDDTVALAKKYTDKIFTHPFDDFTTHRNRALKYAENNFIFSIDADERVSNDLAAAILAEKNKGFEFDAYSMNRLTWYLTGWFIEGGWYPDTKIRLFNCRKARWKGGRVHESIALSPGASTGHLNADLLHYTYLNLEDHLHRINSYSSAAARDRSNWTKIRILSGMSIDPLFKFFKTFFLKRAYVRGPRGFIFSVMASVSVFMKYAKAWELQNRPADRTRSGNSGKST